MNSNDLAEKICDEIQHFREWVQAEGELIARKRENGDESYIPDETHFDAKYTEDSINIERLLINLYNNSVKDNFYFYDCPLQVYKQNYQSRLNEYLGEYIDADELEFIEDEFKGFQNIYDERKLLDRINYHSFAKDIKSFKQTLFKKKEYLQAKRIRIKNSLKFNENNTEPAKDTVSFLLAEDIALKIKSYQVLEKQSIDLKKTSFAYEGQKLLDAKKVLEKKRKVYVKAEKEINSLINELYYSSAEDNFYWFDCPLQVYIENLETNFKKYKKEFLDDNIEDFLKEEVSKFSNFNKHRNLNYKNEKVDYSSFIGFSNKVFEKSRGKKLKFLNEKLKEKNIHIDTFDSYKIRGETTLVPKYDYKEPKAENSLPIPPKSNLVSKEQKTEKQLTSNQIVLLLDKIGFFTYPKIENTSKVKQAEVISKITGLNDKNIKTKIQNLEKLPKELGAQHQKDIDKIDAILDNLE